jgi:hypothetical protein
MARPQKAGIDYFPLDTDIDQDDKIALIEAKYGITGFGVIIKLFKKTYSSNGYYYDWNEETQLLFSKQIGVEFNKIIEIIDDAIRWNLFDSKLYKKYKILTSKRIQATYLKAIYKRKEVEIIKEYVANGVSDIKNLDNVVINSINDINNPQSKVKESKVKESKDKYLDFVYLSKAEHKKLIDQLGEKKTKEYIEKLNAYIGSKGKKYKSHYFTILNWIKMNNDTGNNERKINYL